MADSSREPSLTSIYWPRGMLAGVALGATTLAGGSLVIFDSDGLLTASAGLVATVLVSLLVGMWAGAPAGAAEELPIRERWMAAALATAVAGAFGTVWTMYSALEGSTIGRILGLMVLIAAPAYMIGMVFPTLVASAERREEAGEGAEGWGGLGAIVVGALGGVGLGVLLAGVALIPWLTPGVVLLALSVLLLFPVAIPEPEWPEPDERLLDEALTPFGIVRVTEVAFPAERQPELRLYLDDEQESGELVRSGAPTLAYIAAAEAWLSAGAPAASGYLFLGGGGYTLPRRVAERDPRARITVVELNPEVTRLAYRYFGVRRDHAIATVQGDARAFLDRGPAAEADRIYVDVYGGDETLPFSLVTAEAFTALRSRLRAGGVAGLNLIGVASGPQALRLWSVVRTFSAVFPSVALYTHLGPRYPERQNFLLLGAAEPARALPDRAGLFDRWPSEQWHEPEGVVVLHDLVGAG